MKIPSVTGRKFDIARLAMWQGFVVCVGAIVAVALKEASPGVHIATIVGSFALIQTVGVGAFSAANAAITSVTAWKNAPQSKTEEVYSKKVTDASAAPITTNTEESQ